MRHLLFISGKATHSNIMNILFKLYLLMSFVALMQAKLHRMPMHKDNSAKTMGNILGMQRSTAQKYNFAIENSPCDEEVDTFNATYYSYIYIGTPPQQMKVIFDTEVTGVMAISSQYDPSSSHTALIADVAYFQYDPFTDDSHEATQAYIDVVTIGSLQLATQGVALYDESIGEYGRVGLGTAGPNTNEFGTILGSLKDAGLVSSETFSMYFVNEASSTAPEYAGEIIFGGSDANAYTGSLTYVNSSSAYNSNYQFEVDQLSIGGKTIAKKFNALIDTGTDLIGSPMLPYALINAQLGGVIDDNGNYFVDCSSVDSLPNIELTIAGQTLSLPPSLYILQLTAENGDIQCMSAFYYTVFDHWILGTPVLANNYFEFDVAGNRIGWAPAAPYTGPTSVNVPTPPAVPLPKKICA